MSGLTISVYSAAVLSLIAAGCAADRPSECSRGQRGCVCTPVYGCDDPLVCFDDICTEPEVWTIVVDDPRARSCEVLLQTFGARISDIKFDLSVRGKFAQRGTLSGVSFLKSIDSPFSRGEVAARAVRADETSRIEVSASQCFDKVGHELSSTIRLVR